MEAGWLDPMLLLMRRGIIPTVLVLDQSAFGGRSQPAAILSSLLELDIIHYLISPDHLDRSEMQPGQIGKWGRTPRGHWEPKFDRAALDWRELS